LPKQYAQDASTGLKLSAGTIASQDPFKEERIKAMLGGAGVCSVVSGAINAFRHGYGAIMDIALDCIIPYGWQFADFSETTTKMKDYVQDAFATVKGFASTAFNWAQGTLSSLKEILPGPLKTGAELIGKGVTALRSGLSNFYDTITPGTGETEEFAQEVGIMKAIVDRIWPRGERTIFLTSHNVRELSDSAAEEMYREMKRELERSAAKQYRKTFKKELMDRMQTYVGKGGVKKETIETAFKEANENTIQKLLAGMNAKKFTKLATRAQFIQALDAKVTEAVGGVLEGRAGFSTVVQGAGAKKKFISDTADMLAKEIGAATGVSRTRGIKKQLRTILSQSISEAAADGGKVTLSISPNIKASSGGLAEYISKKYSSQISKKFGGEVAESTLKSLGTTAIEQAVPSKHRVKNLLKRFWRGAWNPRTWMHLIKEAGLGAIPIAIGQQVEEAYYKKLTEGKTPQQAEGKPEMTQKQQELLEALKVDFVQDGKITKAIYAFKLRKKTLGTEDEREPYFFNGKSGEMIKPEEAIPSNIPQSQIWANCDDSYMRPLTATDFFPHTESGSKYRKSKHVELFYSTVPETNQKLGNLITEESRANEIPPALVIAAGITESGFGYKDSKHPDAEKLEYLFGCDKGNPEKIKIEANLKCTVEELSSIMNSCDTGTKKELLKEEIKCIFEAYDSSLTDDELNEAYETVLDWHQFDYSEERYSIPKIAEAS
jgi:hypothetical protein